MPLSVQMDILDATKRTKIVVTRDISLVQNTLRMLLWLALLSHNTGKVHSASQTS